MSARPGTKGTFWKGCLRGYTKDFQRDSPPVPACLTSHSKPYHWMVGLSLARVLVR